MREMIAVGWLVVIGQARADTCLPEVVEIELLQATSETGAPLDLPWAETGTIEINYALEDTSDVVFHGVLGTSIALGE